jgi:hypothetical protein
MKCPELVNTEIEKYIVNNGNITETKTSVKKSLGKCVESECAFWFDVPRLVIEHGDVKGYCTKHKDHKYAK